MDWTHHCAAVIPCFNEAPHVEAVVTEVRRYLPCIIVVDDGSTDGTGGRANAAGAEVIRQRRNGGKGCALRAGWRHASQLGFTWALMMDGDGQHGPDDIPKFFACAGTTGATLVVGDRMGNAAGMPWLRRQVNRWMSRRLSGLAGAWLPDSQCGFRLAHLETLAALPLGGRRFEIESETLLAFLAARQVVEFVPIEVIYESNRSNISPLIDTWRWLRWWTAQSAFSQ
ncbi:MAG: glycosyltransferase family 2 protein [Limisphaerales bacterium]